MNLFFERFIAARMGKGKSAFSKPIVNIAMVSIALGVAVMIVALAIVQGFQEKIREKVIDFGGHFQVTDSGSGLKETNRIEIDSTVIASMEELDGVVGVDMYAVKPAILETNESIQALILKASDLSEGNDFLRKKLIKGSAIPKDGSNALYVSKVMADKLLLDTNQRVTLYFVLSRDDIKPRTFEIAGIYDTGLEEFDKQYAFLDLSHIQKINSWGVQAQWRVTDSCAFGRTWIEPLAFGGNGSHRYTFSNPNWNGPGKYPVCLKSDTSFQVIVSDTKYTLPDTATLHFQVPELSHDSCACQFDYTLTTTGGSERYYAGGYEVLIENYTDLLTLEDSIFFKKPITYSVSNIVQRHPEIFSWLEMLDINVVIIIILMIVVSVINMISAMIIIIIERTTMIGLLKAMGIENMSVIRIFLLHSIRIIGWGILLGNVIGIGFALIQRHFEILTLDAVNYYVSSVPIKIDWWQIIQLDIITLLVCLACLLAPALLVTKVNPVKAIRFN